jgi:chromate transporter
VRTGGIDTVVTNKLLNLSWVFALLSILAVGGGTAVLPEMQRMTVHQFHWVTDRQFRDIYSLGQVAPGPNMLMVMVIGYRQAGAAGAAAVALAFFLPDCLLTFFANRIWARLNVFSPQALGSYFKFFHIIKTKK